MGNVKIFVFQTRAYQMASTAEEALSKWEVEVSQPVDASLLQSLAYSVGPRTKWPWLQIWRLCMDSDAWFPLNKSIWLLPLKSAQTIISRDQQKTPTTFPNATSRLPGGRLYWTVPLWRGQRFFLVEIHLNFCIDLSSQLIVLLPATPWAATYSLMPQGVIFN